MNVFEPHLEKSTFQAMVFLKLTTSICFFQPITVNFELIPSPTWWAATVDLVGGGAVCYNIFNVVIWYRQYFTSLGYSVISCNCYLIWMILYPRKGKCDQWQNCYQLQHPYLIWRIHLSDPQVKPLISDLLRFPQICLFIIYSVVWHLPMKSDMFSMDFNLDYVNPEEGLDKNEEGEGANQPYSGEK